MNESPTKENKSKSVPSTPRLHTRFVTLKVEAGKTGSARIVLDGAYMEAAGFRPGEVIEALVQPELISILRFE